MPPRNETAAPAGAEHSTLYVAIEISRKSWVVGVKSPASERIGLHTLGPADVAGLRALIARHRAKAERALGRGVRVLCCYEAGYEGFWLARWLDRAMSIETVVLDPASLLVNRKAKQRKTDRIDAKKMVRALLAHDRGDAAVLSRGAGAERGRGGPQAPASRAPASGQGADLADQRDRGTPEAARHLRPASSRQGRSRRFRGSVRRRGDSLWIAVPAARPAGGPAPCRAAGSGRTADRAPRGRARRRCSAGAKPSRYRRYRR